jgi:signal transduction histidine kinase
MLREAGIRVPVVCVHRAEEGLRRNEDLLAQQLARVISSLLEEARSGARERQEIVAIVSHDLRTPLQTFALGLDVLKASFGADLPKVASTVARMERSVGSMQRLLGDLLDVSRIRESVLSIQIEKQEPSALIDAVIEQNAPIARAKGLRMTRGECAEGSVACDGARVTQALTNLVGNALRHTEQGTIVVRALPAADEMVRFEVTDTGSGIHPEIKARLFERLYQEPSDGRRTGSLRLGLYLVRGIVLAHGGTFGVESDLGTGSTFWFAIPRSKGARPTHSEGSDDRVPVERRA